MKPKLIIATGNAGKAKEFRALLGQEIEVLTLADFPKIVMPPEDAETFSENALAKAKFVAETVGLPTLADDSGLVVDALDGAPGVRSARYVEGTDQDRYLALLDAMKDVAKDRRSARFVCAMAFVAIDGTSKSVEGTCEGHIVETPEGKNGFGYDPIFRPEGRDSTMATLTMDQKSSISHRGNATKKMLDVLETHFSLELGLRKL